MITVQSVQSACVHGSSNDQDIAFLSITGGNEAHYHEFKRGAFR